MGDMEHAHTYSYPLFKASSSALSDRQRGVRAFAERLRRAESVLVVGGGAVGVEFSGEVLHLYPEKKITLVHSADRLVGTCPPRASRLLADAFLRHPHARLVLSDRIVAAEVRPIASSAV